MLHAAMTYMYYAPEWWYVIDDKKSLAFSLFVVFLDSFPMSALFFLAGYFAPPSLSKRGASVFIRDKFMHIGIPWILGAALVAPFFSYASFLKYGIQASAADFITRWFFGPFYQQGHYWFLGVLFLFFVIYAALGRKGKQNFRFGWEKPVVMSIAALWFFSVLGYYLASVYIKPAVEWVNIGYILYFQHARLAGYAGLFALGAYGWDAGWFKPGGWSPSPIFWGAAGSASSILLLYWKFFKAATLGAQMNLWLDAVLYTTVMISMTFFLAGVFMRVKSPKSKIIQNLPAHSYSIYWLHQIVLMPLLYFLKPYGINIYIKWAVACLFTLSACYALSRFVLKRAPLLKRIF
jgi:hypothetical protein